LFTALLLDIYIYIYYIHSEHRIGDCRFSFGKGSTAALKGAAREHRKAKGKHEGAPREQRGSMREHEGANKALGKNSAQKYRYDTDTIYDENRKNRYIRVSEKYSNCDQKMALRHEELICEMRNGK